MQTGIHFIILVWIMKIPEASLKVMTANVRVIKWNCTKHGLQSCSGYNLKIGYTRSPECTLSTDSIFAFTQNKNQVTFPASSRNGTTFTYIPKSTSNPRLIVVVLDNRDNFKATSCEDLHLRQEQGNTTFIHSDAYFALGSAKYSFEIEIITVCSSTLCTGLLCNHCVTTTEQTFEPSSTTSLTTTTSTTSKLTTTLSTHTTIQQTPIAVITHNNPGEKAVTIVTRIALIVVIIALILVLVIVLYKWWPRNSQVDVNKTSSKSEKEHGERNQSITGIRTKYEWDSDTNTHDVSIEGNQGLDINDYKSGRNDQSKKVENVTGTESIKKDKTVPLRNQYGVSKLDESTTNKNSKGKKDEKENEKDKYDKQIDQGNNSMGDHNEYHMKQSKQSASQAPELVSSVQHTYLFVSEKENCSDDNKKNEFILERSKTAIDDNSVSKRQLEMRNTDSKNERPKTARGSNSQNKRCPDIPLLKQNFVKPWNDNKSDLGSCC